jgi:O-antigen/teichoic acid export membrane protein
VFLKNAVAYSGTNVIAQAARFVQEFAIRRILPPELLGIWNFSLVVQEFASSFDVGIVDAASRELPILHGSGKRDEEKRVRSTAFWSKAAQHALLAAAVIGYTILFWQQYDDLYKAALLSAALLILLGSIRETFITFHQSRLRYVPLSKVLLLSSLWYAVTLPIGAFLGGILGLICAALISFILQAVLIYLSGMREDLRVGGIWEWGIFQRLIGFGLPLRIVDYPISFVSMVDVLFVTKFMGVEALAIYSTAKAILGQAQEVLSRIGNVFIMRMFTLSGQNESRQTLASELMRFLIVSYLILIPVGIVAVLYGISALIAAFIPKYSGAISILKIVIFMIYFTPQTTLVRNVWMLEKRLRPLGISNLVGLLAVSVCLLGAVMIFGETLEAVALAMVIGYGGYFLYLMLSVGKELWGLKEAVKLVLFVFLSVLYTAGIVFGLDKVGIAHLWSSGFLASAVGLIFSLLLLVPLIYVGCLKSRCLVYLKQGNFFGI